MQSLPGQSHSSLKISRLASSALGITAALLRRATVGGAYVISPALAQTCTWYVLQLGMIPEDAFEEAVESGAEEYRFGFPAIVDGDTPKGFYHRQGHMLTGGKHQ